MSSPVTYEQTNIALIREVPALVALFDLDMRYVACSDRWLAAHELAWKDIGGRSQYDLFPQTPQGWRDVHRQILAGQIVPDVEMEYRPGGDPAKRIRWKMLPRRDDTGQVVGAVVFGEDLTELTKAQAAYREVASELDLLVHNAVRHAIYMLDPAGRVRLWNTGAERLFGWTEAEAIGRDGAFLYRLADVERGLPRTEQEMALRDGVFAGHSERVRKDGSVFTADVAISPVYAENGLLIGYGRVVHDVSDAIARERELALHIAQMRSIIDTVPDAMVTIDEHGIVQSFGPAAEELFGYKADEVTGRNVSILMPETDAVRHDGYLARYHRTGERRIIGHKRRVLGKRKDGSTFPHELYVGEAVSEGTRLYTGFLRDLRAREQSDSALREVQAELVRISRVSAVGTMATALAHDLNQPLAAVVNYVQAAAALLERPDRDPDQLRVALREAASEALRAGSIVHKLREFIASGDTIKSLISPATLLGHACELGTAGFHDGTPQCHVDVPADLPIVLADPVQIQQVMFNLVRNAVIAVGPGQHSRIELSATAQSGEVRFEVRDNGPGVPPDRLARLFEPLAGTDTGGMGLGLAICRTIVESHGGRLWHERAPGGGAVFRFTLPVAEESKNG